MDTIKSSFQRSKLPVTFLLFPILLALAEIAFLLRLTATQQGGTYPDGGAPTDAPPPPNELRDVHHRYFVYNRPELQSLLRPPNGTAEMSTAHGAVWSIYMALLSHPLRTLDPNEAAFFFAPIFVNQARANDFAGSPGRRDFMAALDVVTSDPIYQSTLGSRHIIVAIDGLHFGWRGENRLARAIKYYEPEWLKNSTNSRWWDGDDMPCNLQTWKSGECPPAGNVFRNIILARDRDLAEVRRMRFDQIDYREWTEMIRSDDPIPSFGFSIGLLGGPGEVELIPASLTKYHEAKWLFFYHTREDDFACNSTIYRHALVTHIPANGTAEAELYRQSSTGFDLNREEWNHRFIRSKFCLVIRGDTPSSKALLRSLRAGCIPVVVSDLYPRYAPSFKSTLNMSDYSIFLDERSFANNPWRELHRMYSRLTPSMAAQKLRALAYAQRVIFPDAPDSLFVPAFLREAWESIPESERGIGCKGSCV